MLELQFILKIASRCNLNCTYCYVYNKGDTSWKRRPALMSDEVFRAAISRIRSYCLSSGQSSVRITFHGGEPCLLGAAQFSALCQFARSSFEGVCNLYLSIQTNGTLVDSHWIDVLRKFDVSVGLSLDGPQDINDASRVTHSGQGSFTEALRGGKLIRDGGLQHQILCVIQPGADGLRIHRSFVDLGFKRINYLLPDFTHDTVGAVVSQFGPSPCADFLLPILNHWWTYESMEIRVSLFISIARLILGGTTEIDVIGNAKYQYIFVETDGTIEGLDVLRVCAQKYCVTHLNVLDHDFSQIFASESFYYSVIRGEVPLPSACSRCCERSTCGGGYLPHRYSKEREFDNRTVWCQDMLILFGRMRQLLNVDTNETEHRRRMLVSN